MFSRISATLAKQPAHTLPSLHKVIHAIIQAGKAFCLKDLMYQEINDLEIADEASAKRVGELERLMDKNNIFPKVSVFVTNVSVRILATYTIHAVHCILS